MLRIGGRTRLATPQSLVARAGQQRNVRTAGPSVPSGNMSVAAGDTERQSESRRRLTGAPRWQRLSLGFSLSFVLGFLVQWFAIRTGLYETVADKKMQRRIEMDEMVLELRGNVAKWQAEDMRIAAERAAAAAAAPHA
jgi:hypothetical protein